MGYKYLLGKPAISIISTSATPMIKILTTDTETCLKKPLLRITNSTNSTVGKNVTCDTKIEHLDGYLIDQQMHCILLDEEQKVDKFVDVLSSYLNVPNADVYVIGSKRPFPFKGCFHSVPRPMR